MQSISDLDGKTIYPLSQLLDPEAVPGNLIEFEQVLSDLFEHVFYTDAMIEPTENGYIGKITLVFDQEIAVAPFGDVAQLVIGGGGGLTIFEVEISLESQPGGYLFDLAFMEVPAILRIPAGILRPLIPGTKEPDLEATNLEIDLGTVTIRIGTNQPIDVEIISEPGLPQCMIGDTGVLLTIGGIRWLTPGSDGLPENTPPEFVGLYLEGVILDFADIELDGNPAFKFEYAFFGFGGITALINISGLSQSGTFAGFEFELQEISLSLTQNAITQSGLSGNLMIPFFETTVHVDMSLAMDGSFGVSLSAGGGLLSIDIPQLGSLSLTSLGFNVDDLGLSLLLSGKFLLVVGSPTLDWPEVEIQNLGIFPDGKIQIPGGWLDFQKPVVLDLYGFRMEMSRLGFGNEEDGRRRVCFSGGLHLVELLPSGVSVEGLCIIWDPSGRLQVEISLDGVGLELTIPEVLSLAGSVAMIHEVVKNDDGEVVSDQRYFKGFASLDIIPVGIKLDASIKIGHDLLYDYNFFYTFLNLELPVGIPLWATGAAIYGFSGLFGMNVLPTTTDNDWYKWYKDPPKFDVTATDKWGGELDGRAFGAGLVIGTLFDAAYVVSAKALFALVIPGPVILIHGMANVLQLPPKLGDSSSEGVFNTLTLLDAGSGFLQLNLDAGWSLAKVIEISASAEAYFDFANPRNWHLYLGQDKPPERRIRASVISLFHADSYLMIDPDGIATGFGVNWGADWKFGPVKAVMRSWIEAQAGITWRPFQLGGSLGLGGEFEISVAGFGVGLSIEATLSGKAPTLYHVRGLLSLQVKLPTPIKDLEEEILLEWKEEKDPASEDPFDSFGLEHLKVDESWLVVDSDEELDPDQSSYDPGPIVPLDARPSITFNRSMKDETTSIELLSVNEYAGPATIGEHSFDYLVKDISLGKWSKAGGKAWDEVDNLYGTWLAIEDGTGEPAASKLQIWTKSPFEFTRRSARTYRDAFLANHIGWPCGEVSEPIQYCIDWEEYKLHIPFGPVFEQEGLTFILEKAAATVERRVIKDCGSGRTLKFANGESLWIVFPEAVCNVEICLDGQVVSAGAYANGTNVEQLEGVSANFTFSASSIDAIYLERGDGVYLARICYQTQADTEASEAAQEHMDRLEAGLSHWASEDEILEPEMWYRLTLHLETVRTHNGQEYLTSFDHYAYFQTAGPPGLTPAWALPAVGVSAGTASDPNSLSGNEKAYPEGGQLIDASPYVQWTIPAHGAQPVYRAYDLGAEFNENYVEQMYGADMVIRLLDGNGAPILDEEGNEISFLNQWGKVPTAELSETEYPILSRIADCQVISVVSLPPNHKIIASSGILLEEDFSGDLEQWTDTTEPDGDPNAHWAIQEGRLLYDGTVIPALGALLVAGEDDWSNYAIEVTLTDLGDEVGIVFYHNQTDLEFYYRLRLDAFGRRLERVSNNTVEVVWEDDVAYAPGAVGILAIQCLGNRVRGQMDLELMFDLLVDDDHLSGKVGIYANATAAFEHFLVREWPGGLLAPRTMYSAELLASFVLFQGGLIDGWVDSQSNWSELTKARSHIATIGREDWDNYRVEVNIDSIINQAGVIVRFIKHPDNTFTCYRLLINPDKGTLRLARLEGTYSGSTYELDDGKSVLWSFEGSALTVDLDLDQPGMALTCEGATLIIELNGQELGRIIDQNPLLSGQAGLFYESEEHPDFSELVIRSATRNPVLHWSFITSNYEGLVELMDSFTGTLYTEEVTGIDLQQLGGIVEAARTGLEQAVADVETSRQALEGALADEITLLRLEAQRAVSELHTESARHYEALYELFFNSTYRSAPPVVEISEIRAEPQCSALLLECPEPIDWSRLNVRLSRLKPSTNRYQDIEEVLALCSEDGTRTFFVLTGNSAWLAGEYRLNFDYHLDLGAEASLLRRCGSTLPEVAVLFFSLSEMTNG